MNNLSGQIGVKSLKNELEHAYLTTQYIGWPKPMIQRAPRVSLIKIGHKSAI